MSQLSTYSNQILRLLRIGARMIAPLLRTRLPDETSFKFGLIVASASFEKVNKLIDLALQQHPTTLFLILSDDRNEQQVAEQWPHINQRVFHRASSRGEKWNLIVELINKRFDVCIFLAAGDLHYDFLKSVGILCGAKYIQAYNELFDPFYFMLGQIRAILGHLVWRSKHQYASDIPNVKISFLRSGIGYAISLVRVIPLLHNAKKFKDARNPFVDVIICSAQEKI